MDGEQNGNQEAAQGAENPQDQSQGQQETQQQGQQQAEGGNADLVDDEKPKEWLENDRKRGKTMSSSIAFTKNCASATDVLVPLREVTSLMDEVSVSIGIRYPFIALSLEGILGDCSCASPMTGNRMLGRFVCVVEVFQVRFCTAINPKSDDTEFGCAKAEDESLSASWWRGRSP